MKLQRLSPLALWPSAINRKARNKEQALKALAKSRAPDRTRVVRINRQREATRRSRKDLHEHRRLDHNLAREESRRAERTLKDVQRHEVEKNRIKNMEIRKQRCGSDDEERKATTCQPRETTSPPYAHVSSYAATAIHRERARKKVEREQRLKILKVQEEQQVRTSAAIRSCWASVWESLAGFEQFAHHTLLSRTCSQRQVAEEARRRWEAEKKIAAMERDEADLVERLKLLQVEQFEAYSTLQAAIESANLTQDGLYPMA
eukprot:scaffold1311_cov256-Pinguiococcus_pyrenoidosus.AAC.22